MEVENLGSLAKIAIHRNGFCCCSGETGTFNAEFGFTERSPEHCAYWIKSVLWGARSIRLTGDKKSGAGFHRRKLFFPYRLILLVIKYAFPSLNQAKKLSVSFIFENFS